MKLPGPPSASLVSFIIEKEQCPVPVPIPAPSSAVSGSDPGRQRVWCRSWGLKHLMAGASCLCAELGAAMALAVWAIGQVPLKVRALHCQATPPSFSTHQRHTRLVLDTSTVSRSPCCFTWYLLTALPDVVLETLSSKDTCNLQLARPCWHTLSHCWVALSRSLC